MDLIRKSLRSLLRSLVTKSLIDNIFVEGLGLSQKILENFYVSNLDIPNHYPDQKIWIKLFTVLGGKFKSSAQDSDLEFLSWRCKNSGVSSD